jgi:methyl-accepting chemotaxis protein
VVSQGKLQAVITSDISLASLQEKVNQIKPWEGGGYAVLLSTAGKVISYPDKKMTSKPFRATRITSLHRLWNNLTPSSVKML